MILYTGGYRVEWTAAGHSLRLAGHTVALPIILLLAAGAARLALGSSARSWGPRLLADLTPWLALSLYPVIAQWSASRAFRVVFAVLAAWSIGAHAIGAFVDDGSWNERADVENAPGRLWSWTDNQLVNPLRDAWSVGSRTVSNRGR